MLGASTLARARELRYFTSFFRGIGKNAAQGHEKTRGIRLASLTLTTNGYYANALKKRLNTSLRTSQNQRVNVVRAFVGVDHL